MNIHNMNIHFTIVKWSYPNWMITFLERLRHLQHSRSFSHDGLPSLKATRWRLWAISAYLWMVSRHTQFHSRFINCLWTVRWNDSISSSAGLWAISVALPGTYQGCLPLKFPGSVPNQPLSLNLKHYRFSWKPGQAATCWKDAVLSDSPILSLTMQ